VNERERESIAGAIQMLPEKERLVLTLYYYEELTMKEIGELLKVTESRVCQIHTKAIIRLKATLEAVS
jgi:RNA polymerase sigma factor for flagellar operon FliA